MAGNKFGNIFTLSTFGESHGAAIGGVLEGCPAGLEIDFSFIQSELDRRKPGQSNLSTTRKESDEVEFLSGIFEGRTLGTPIGFLIRNQDQRSEDYSQLKDIYRPGHADETWDLKFGHRDYRGGGRSSARETSARVVAGAIAKLLLKKSSIEVRAYVSRVKDISTPLPYHEMDLSRIESNPIRCPHEETASKMITLIEEVRSQGDTVGGIITCVCTGLPAGLGEPVFDKLHAVLAHAMLSINATKGFELDHGFESTHTYGSENNKIMTGIAGGISNGQDLVFHVAFKPVSSIAKMQEATNKNGEKQNITIQGRHDPCVLPRAVPIVDSMAALVFADMLLLQKLNSL